MPDGTDAEARGGRLNGRAQIGTDVPVLAATATANARVEGSLSPGLNRPALTAAMICRRSWTCSAERAARSS